ncbi:MAG: glycosyltransferase family 2 protein [Planctomycetota bacterium]|jgi:glycosyltransferase involved in cell wall biosynthesis
MKISVVIPAYNAEKHIARAIESVLAQTRPADEVIVIDDGSSDGTGDVVRSFGDKVIFIQQENAGASVARNAGIEAATSDWIAFLDADDEWLPNKLQLQVEHFKRNPDLLWATGNYVNCQCGRDSNQCLSDQGEARGLLKGKEFFEDYFQAYRQVVTGNTDTLIIRKDILLEAGLFLVGQLRINDDDLWFRVAYRHPVIGYLSEPLAIYHRGVENSIIKKYLDPFIICDFLDRHLELSKKFNSSERFRPVATLLLKNWIHRCWADERIFVVRGMVKRNGYLLPKGYKVVFYILTIFPRITLMCMPVFRKINKILKLPL